MTLLDRNYGLAPGGEEIAAKWGWFLALGLGLIALGIAAIFAPHYATLAGSRIFAWLMIISGFIAAVHAAEARGWSGAIFQALIAAAYLLTGFWLLSNTVPGILVLTIALMALLFVHGVLSVLEALQLRPSEGWGRLLFSGICSIVLGALLWMKFPSSALWAIGLLFGLHLLINGSSFVSLALGARR